MKHVLIIFTLIISFATAVVAGGHDDAIQSFIENHHPNAKHLQMHESSEGLTMVTFTDHDMTYKIGFDLNDRPCCSEVQISAKDLPLNIQANIPSGVKTEYISYNSTTKRHFYAVEYIQGTQHIKRHFNEDGSELH